MRYPIEWYQMQQLIATHLPNLRPAQQRGLCLWVYGSIKAHSAAQSAVIAALLAVAEVRQLLGSAHALRQLLREWCYEGQDRAAPCKTQLDVRTCFAPLLRWLLAWWQTEHLPLALDVTTRRDEITVVCLSVLYRSSAIPIAWHVLPGNKPGAWIAPLLELLELLDEQIPPHMQVLLMTDRGLNSAALWQWLREHGWHPLMRQPNNVTFQPHGGRRKQALSLVGGPGAAWIGQGVAYSEPAKRRNSTLLVVWGQGQKEPWILLTDLAPKQVGSAWYGLRVWIELGFRALKGFGWEWQRGRRTDPERVSRHWLVLAVASLLVVAVGTRSEEAEQLGVAPARLHMPAQLPPMSRGKRWQSVFRRGLGVLNELLASRRIWRRLWLRPEPWPDDLPDVHITYHLAPVS